MANVFLAAALLSSILAVSGCMGGLLPNLGALGTALGGYPSQGGYPAYGGGQPYPYNPGAGGGYAQPGQPYYQPQPYAYSGSGNPEIYYQPTPQASPGYTAPSPDRWTDPASVAPAGPHPTRTGFRAINPQRSQAFAKGAAAYRGWARTDGSQRQPEYSRTGPPQSQDTGKQPEHLWAGAEWRTSRTYDAVPAHEGPAACGASAPGGTTASRGPTSRYSPTADHHSAAAGTAAITAAARVASRKPGVAARIPF